MFNIYEDKLSNHTTFKIGGLAKIFQPRNLDELKQFLIENKKKYFVLGNGSNILAGNYIKPIIIKTNLLDKIYKKGNIVCVESGVNLFRLIKFCADNGLSGLEALYGIPSSVGGAIYMNAGSFGTEIGQFVTSVDYLDSNGILHKKIKPKFSYRNSFFTNKNYVITMVRLKLLKDTPDNICKKCEYYFNLKKAKQPYNYPSAGSVFKRVEDVGAPIFIEKAGLKGLKIGGAMISDKHCGFVINVNNAKFNDVKQIICKIKKTVLKKFGIILTREIVVIGDKNGDNW